MIQQQTKLKIADNTGVKLAKCIQIVKKSRQKGKIGDIVTVSIKKLKKNSNLKLKKKSVVKAVILRTTKFSQDKNGFYIKFNNNSIAFLDNQKNPVGNRILGLIPRKLKKKYTKLVSLTAFLI